MNPIKAKAYKVLRGTNHPHVYLSANPILSSHLQHSVTYETGELVQAPHPDRGLFVFGELKAARLFARDMMLIGGVWEVEAYGITKAPAEVLDLYMVKPELQEHIFDLFWSRPPRKLSGAHNRINTPWESYVCKSLRLVKHLEPEV